MSDALGTQDRKPTRRCCWPVVLLGVVVALFVRDRMLFPYFCDERWGVRGAFEGDRNITAPLLFALWRGLLAVWKSPPEWVMLFLGVYALRGVTHDPYARHFMKYTDSRPLHALLSASRDAHPVPVFASRLALDDLAWYKIVPDPLLRPIGGAMSEEWNYAWVVADDGDREDGAMLQRWMQRSDLEVLTCFNRHERAWAVLFRRRQP